MGRILHASCAASEPVHLDTSIVLCTRCRFWTVVRVRLGQPFSARPGGAARADGYGKDAMTASVFHGSVNLFEGDQLATPLSSAKAVRASMQALSTDLVSISALGGSAGSSL